MSVVFDFNASLNDDAPLSPISLTADLMRMKECIVDDGIYILFLFLSSHLRLSFASVAFIFNASHNDSTPLFLIMFSVDLMRMGNNRCLWVFFLFLLSLLLRLSSISVLFDFNASLNDVAPLSSILFTVDLMRMEKSGLLMDISFVCCFFCLHHSNQV